MTEFTPWTMLVDAGIISLLLLLGKIMRVKVKWMQQLFIPPSLIAGFLGLALGRSGLGWLPLSGNLGTYSGILIALVFSCLPFTSSGVKGERAQIARMWSFSQSGMLLQWALGGLLGYFVFSSFWEVESFFGLAMPSGFVGGHGTAAAIGSAFRRFGYDEMLTFAMTAATVGIVCSVLLGLVIVKWGTRKGEAAFLTDFSELPHELRTGLLPEDKQKSIGKETTSSISIDTLSVNLGIIVLITLGGYYISQLVAHYVPDLQLPVFSCAFVVGILIHFIAVKTKAATIFCPKTISHMSGAFTDYLVAFGISSIQLSVVFEYFVPLLLLLIAGLVGTFLYVFLLGRTLFKGHCWFEKSLFTWGWFTGTMAMGIALLRTVDPEMRSRCLEDYALAYLFIAPVEISLITFAPILFVSGYGLHFVLATLIAGLGILLFARLRGWLRTSTAF